MKNAAVAASESTALSLRDFLNEALNEHAPLLLGDFSRLTSPREQELVLLLAHERVCISRASQYAPQGTTQQSSVTFNADRNTPFDKNTKLAVFLRNRYNELKTRYKEEGSVDSFETNGDIVIGSIYKEGEDVPSYVPFHTAPPRIPSLSIEYMDKGTGTIVLRCLDIDETYAEELFVFLSTTPGIYQSWNYDGSGDVPIPFARADAEIIHQSTDIRRKACRVTDRLPLKHYAICAYRTATGDYIYSDEIVVALNDAVTAAVPLAIEDLPLSTFE